jgi:2-phospho-L-lactate/phosphoenolpyruvate guanylyltransferase
VSSTPPPVASVTAIVPVRSPGTGKTRLASDLTPEQRAGLAGAMLADVTAALRASSVERIVVAASGPAAASAASALGLDVVLDPPGSRSLDEAVAAAVVRAGRTDALLIVMADLPRLSPADVDEVIGADAQVVVAPTGDGGTGALLRRPATIIGTSYGPSSAGRHLRLARAAGAAASTVTSPGFVDDVDTLEDLAALRRGPVGRATAAFLRSTALLGDRG